MSERKTLRVTMELLSDTIFGSGFSIPGGEDVAVCIDGQGYPYLKGSTFKGLLRESLENWMDWTDGSLETVNTLLGAEKWNGRTDGRRVQVTALTLADKPTDPAECFALRTFTSLEDGIVKEDTLRTASCVRAGRSFSGELTCDAGDVALMKNVLMAIKWAGTMRSRGFGAVKVTVSGEKKVAGCRPGCGEGGCVRYRLHTEAPVFVTNLSRSRSNSYETRGYIPGSAVRGMVMSELAARMPEWFQAHRAALLSDQTRFLDAVPVVGDLVPLPSIKGFYEDKDETDFVSVLMTDGKVRAGYKRAKLGTFCALEKDTVRYWSAETDGVTRIQRNVNDENKNTEPFQNRYLSAGQDFEGYILADDPAVMEKLTTALTDTVWLGADRYEGFGKCTVTWPEAVRQPTWLDEYGCQESEGNVLYLLAISPVTMLNSCGEPCGIDTQRLAELLGVETVTITVCSTSLAEFGGYNRAWESRIPAVQMYDRGSVFRIECSTSPSLDAVRKVELQGLGIRRAEGFGQVLFLSKSRFEALQHKAAWQKEEQRTASTVGDLRRARYRWVMQESERIRRARREDDLSDSQLGTIQALCEKAIANIANKGVSDKNKGAYAELNQHLEHNCKDRGPKHGKRFGEIKTLINKVLETPLAETLGVPCAKERDSTEERLRLLCLLFDYSRKKADEKEASGQ
ncbi:MAG: RAMP superfamily CRISPR-associated protein [Clostridiales bacterium]|nr:RAMP superfamily CRISPR-associated protein [Clostridiales bacterium]MCC8098987.1 RAMP superfamily CRISPR-associated protein [Clostridiales bacterium]